MNRNFIPVRQQITVCVRLRWVRHQGGICLVHLCVVIKTIVIGIGRQRIRACGRLARVVQAVPIDVGL